MVSTYEEYIKLPKALSLEQMQIIHKQIVSEVGNDPDALELYNDLIKVATRYAAIRANWLLMSREEKMEQDPSRTSCHNSVITHFNFGDYTF